MLKITPAVCGRFFCLMMMKAKSSSVFAVFYFLLGIWGVWFCLSPGLSGGFLFDDYPNLKDLGAYGGVTDWATFKAYVTGGMSGPSGRPFSLLSFLLDDNTWPSDPYGFKSTNLFIHLLVFCVLVWLNLNLLHHFGFDKKRAEYVAVLAAVAWALHPFLVSTTLYVVQRMAQLSTLFVFAGLALYLHGRKLFESSRSQGLLYMGFGISLGMVLATLSKENGVLLPLLALTIEAIVPFRTPRLPNWFSALFLWLPSIAVGFYLLRSIDLSPNPWPARPFNQIERVMTESRILFDYWESLLVPRIEDRGLYQDGYLISRSVFNPPSTLFSVIGHFSILGIAWVIKRRFPLVALAVFFFYVSHILESTILGLELYFEHRNYMAAALVFLPLMAGLSMLNNRVSPYVAYACPLALLLLLGGLTHQRAVLWGDPDRLELYWAIVATESPRAQNALASQYWRQGRFAEALGHIDVSASRLPNSSLLTVNQLLIRVRLDIAKPEDFQNAAKKLAEQPFDAQSITSLRHLVDDVRADSVPPRYREGVMAMIESLETNAHYHRFPLFLRIVPYLKGQLMLADGEVEKAELFYQRAISLYGNVDSAMQMVAEVANAGYPNVAIRLLDQAESIFLLQEDKSLKFDRSIYRREIDRIRLTLNEELRRVHE